nr:immunoglobulin heavy chain junction region [Macaca mulatta]MOW23409.1 immunoglobulin heavy chain junction region [Macaca mulatta]MOW23766.1 immunoglobulin heavy chain junction region [Macaca mulatta]MOW24161.1 immunoglobulin heavy chain junction region [Macaca mulatta]MOW24511.1 immunoglobulin heavy chain junction region [Macaca mulatta]
CAKAFFPDYGNTNHIEYFDFW